MRWGLLIGVWWLSACTELERAAEISTVLIDGKANEWASCEAEAVCLQLAHSSQGSFMLIATSSPELIQQMILTGVEVKIAGSGTRLGIRYPVLRGSPMDRLREVLGQNNGVRYSLEDIAVKGVLDKSWVVTEQSRLEVINAALRVEPSGPLQRRLFMELQLPKLSADATYKVKLTIGDPGIHRQAQGGYWVTMDQQAKRIKKKYKL